MRNTKEMLDLIMQTALQDEEIRAVILQGSRTNPTIHPDIFQDFDILYVVKDPLVFLMKPNWIDCFGERLMMQKVDETDASLGHPVNFTQEYTYLMLFHDGNRIDLKLMTIERAKEVHNASSLSQLLLDKDQLFSAKISSDADYWIHRPVQATFSACTNEFWWCLQNVAKGIYREEIAYAKTMYDLYVRTPLHQMMDWHIGLPYDFCITSGKHGKFYKSLLNEMDYTMFLQTYSDADIQHFWKAIYTACAIFHRFALEVAAKCQLQYFIEEEEHMLTYLRRVEHLSPNAEEIW